MTALDVDAFLRLTDADLDDRRGHTTRVSGATLLLRRVEHGVCLTVRRPGRSPMRGVHASVAAALTTVRSMQSADDLTQLLRRGRRPPFAGRSTGAPEPDALPFAERIGSLERSIQKGAVRLARLQALAPALNDDALGASLARAVQRSLELLRQSRALVRKAQDLHGVLDAG